MPDQKELDALSKIKAYIDSGHSLDDIREAGWASWIDHLEAKGYDPAAGRVALKPPHDPPPTTTREVSPDTQNSGPTNATLANLSLGGAGLLAILGAILPWAEGPFGSSVAGTEGDGIMTLIGGLVLIGLAAGCWLSPRSVAWRRWFVPGGGLISGAMLLLAMYVMANVGDLAGESDGLVRVGSGLYVTLVAGGLGLLGAVVKLAVHDDIFTWFEDFNDSIANRLRLPQVIQDRALKFFVGVCLLTVAVLIPLLIVLLMTD